LKALEAIEVPVGSDINLSSVLNAIYVHRAFRKPNSNVPEPCKEIFEKEKTGGSNSRYAPSFATSLAFQQVFGRFL
jgi:hypothetical protein